MNIDISNFDVLELLGMAHSPVSNYIVPDLTSSLIGGRNKNGCVRLFESTRNQQLAITPHSHRFDFQCIVLQGEVKNRIFTRDNGSISDLYAESVLEYKNKIGSHNVKQTVFSRWSYEDFYYSTGECYSMTRSQVHSIYFSKSTKVLFFEGKNRTKNSIILEPVSNGKVIPTYKVEDWMFNKGN